MRLLYALFAFFMWAIVVTGHGASRDAELISLAIVIAGAMAGGDGK